MPVYLLWQDTPRPERENNNRLFDEENYQDLIARCAQKIEHLAQENELLDVKKLNIILLRWKEWTDNGDSLNRFVLSALEEPEKTLKFIAGFVSSGGTASGTDHTITYNEGIIIEQISEFVPEKDICRSVSQISKESISNITDSVLISVYHLALQMCNIK